MEQMEVDEPEVPRPPTIWGRFKSAMSRVHDGFYAFEKRISATTFGRSFRLAGSGHPKEIPNADFWNEVRAGATTFTTMAYIIAVNATVLSQTGGTCECNEPSRFDCNAIPEYMDCKETLRRDLITATAAASGVASFIFGLLTNLPVALAPGMGLNAYFAFQVVGPNGSGAVPYRLALTAVFVEGLIFVLLALTGMRQWLVKIIPATIKTATGVGIGLFLTELGLSYAIGIGAISGGYDMTPLALAGCELEDLDPVTKMCPAGDRMSSPKMWVGILAGGILTSYLMCFRYKFALMTGVLMVSFISWPRNSPVTYFPRTDAGDARFEYFKQVVSIHPIRTTLNQLQWDLGGHASQFALALCTFLYVDLIDATATLYSMVRFCGVVDPRDGDFPRSTVAYCTDGACVSFGALLGLSPVTAFIESGAGIAEGGRTGITSMTTGVCFLVSIFFSPLVASIPPWATGCTLILVGCMMLRQITQINWKYLGDSIPSFVVVTFIPFSYSVAYGLIAGIFVYTLLNGLIALTVVLSRHRWEPSEYDLKEYWTLRVGASGRPVWYVRLLRKVLGPRRRRDGDNDDDDNDDDDGEYTSRGDGAGSKNGLRGDAAAAAGAGYGCDGSGGVDGAAAAAGASEAPEHEYPLEPSRSVSSDNKDRLDGGEPAAVPRDMVRPPATPTPSSAVHPPHL